MRVSCIVVFSALILLPTMFSCTHCPPETQTRKDSLIDMANDFANNKDYEKAIPLFSQIIDLDSTSGRYYFSRGLCYSELEDKNTESNADFLKAASLNFKADEAFVKVAFSYSTPPPPSKYIPTMNELKKNDSIALFYFKKALEANPSNTVAKNMVKGMEQLKYPDSYEK